jgi:membrane associated rhomboid family serine protease
MAPTWEDPGVRSVSFAPPSMTPVVKTLLIANIAVFLVQMLLINGSAAQAPWEYWAALNPAAWVEHFPLVPLWQLVTYGFLHGDPMHILGNMLFLYFLGTMLEGEIGSRRFVAFYAVAIVLAGACQLFVGLALRHYNPIVGASGAVLAIVCAMATMRPQTRVIFIIVPLTLKTLALIYVSLDLFNMLMDLKHGTTGVAHFAHLAGAGFGFASVRRGWIWRDPLQEVEGWRERKREEQQSTDEERLDALLAKISREGIHSLSPRERAFLKRVSQR